MDEEINNAFSMIEDAKNFEKMGNLLLAKDLYFEGIEIFMNIAKKENNAAKKKIITSNIKSFLLKAEEIKKRIDNGETANINIMPSAPPINDNNLNLPDPPTNEGDTIIDDIEDAQNVLDEAIEFDQIKDYTNAINKYKMASQLFIDAIKSGNIADKAKKKSREKVNIILERIEVLNGIILKDNKHIPKLERKESENKGLTGEGLSQKEIQVLRDSSKIRNIVLYPWMVCTYK